MDVVTLGPPWAYPVGCVVAGRGFRGRVVEMTSPWTVRIDGNVIVPHSLIESADFEDDAEIEKSARRR